MDATRPLFRLSESGRCLLAVVVAVAAGVTGSDEGEAATYTVRTAKQFHAAVERIGNRAGTIILGRGRYGALYVGPRGARARWLTVRARQGALTGDVRLVRSRRVLLDRLQVTTYAGRDARLHVSFSRQVRIERALVFATPARTARIRVRASRQVTIEDSDIGRCGERMGCLGLPGSDAISIVGNTFHDCYGCDFVHASHVDGLVIRRNTFDRALPGPCGMHPSCNHQDLVQLLGGRGWLVEANRFGLYSYGAAQLYISGQYPTDDVIVRGNVFLRSDPSVPGLEAANGIIVGNPPGTRGLPTGVVIAGNTILSGSPRDPERFRYWPGVSNSLILSEGYATLLPEERPIVVNNFLARTSDLELLCPQALLATHNFLADATPCTELGLAGDPLVDDAGYPEESSPLVGRADPSWATATDITGWPRDAEPDIGAYERRP